jgi:hypothetical protein
VASTAAGATTVNLRSTADLLPGTEIIIGGERRTVNLPMYSAEGCDARREAHFYCV